MLSDSYCSGSASQFPVSQPSGDLSRLCRLTQSCSGLGFDDAPVSHTGTWVETGLIDYTFILSLQLWTSAPGDSVTEGE